MDPQTGLTLFNAIASVGKTLFEIAQGASKIDEKQRLMEVYDSLMNLKRDAANLEDENRELKLKLRFKTEDFEFRNPFWYDKNHLDRALCPKCFSKNIAAPMAEPYNTDYGLWSKCLSCETIVEVKRGARQNGSTFTGGNTPDDWMR